MLFSWPDSLSGRALYPSVVLTGVSLGNCNEDDDNGKEPL